MVSDLLFVVPLLILLSGLSFPLLWYIYSHKNGTSEDLPKTFVFSWVGARLCQLLVKTCPWGVCCFAPVGLVHHGMLAGNCKINLEQVIEIVWWLVRKKYNVINIGITLDKWMQILGLDICADTIVGDEMRRGVSGGQRKRVTTGLSSSISICIFFVLGVWWAISRGH